MKTHPKCRMCNFSICADQKYTGLCGDCEKLERKQMSQQLKRYSKPPHANTTECPFIDRGIDPNPKFNKKRVFRFDNGYEYVYYEHDDGFGKIYPAQFCQLVGRKRDVFQCVNIVERETCYAYMSCKIEFLRYLSLEGISEDMFCDLWLYEWKKAGGIFTNPREIEKFKVRFRHSDV